jgi:hypothetical protein
MMDRTVGIVTKPWAEKTWFHCQQGKTLFPKCPDPLQGLSSSKSINTKASFLRGKAAEAWSWQIASKLTSWLRMKSYICTNLTSARSVLQIIYLYNFSKLLLPNLVRCNMFMSILLWNNCNECASLIIISAFITSWNKQISKHDN